MTLSFASDTFFLPLQSLPFALSFFSLSAPSCRRCGVVLPREVHAIEAHDDTCAGYNEAEEEEPDLRSAVVDYSHDEPPDALQADDVTIADAFVCPMCFEAFPDQVWEMLWSRRDMTKCRNSRSWRNLCVPVFYKCVLVTCNSVSSCPVATLLPTFVCAKAAVLDHFQSSNCGSGGGDHINKSGAGGGGDESSNVSKTVEGRHMAGVTMNGTRPGMDLKGWAEKHNSVKVMGRWNGKYWHV